MSKTSMATILNNGAKLVLWSRSDPTTATQSGLTAPGQPQKGTGNSSGSIVHRYLLPHQHKSAVPRLHQGQLLSRSSLLVQSTSTRSTVPRHSQPGPDQDSPGLRSLPPHRLLPHGQATSGQVHSRHHSKLHSQHYILPLPTPTARGTHCRMRS